MFKALIVDDERLARAELKRLLSKHVEIDIVAEASSSDKAQEVLASEHIDLVFLDIQMPGMTGIELAEHLDSDIRFVFCTAFNQYAVDAFTLNAVDYLVKPVNPERLSQCIAKLQQEQKEDPRSSRSHFLPDDHGILLKFGDINRIVKLAEIERFESVGNHCAVYTLHGKSWVHSSLSKVEARLDPERFFKASRSDIVRVDGIDRIEPGIKTGVFIAVLKSGAEVEVSRRQAQSLKQSFSAF